MVLSWGTVQPVFQFCQHTNSPFDDAIIVTGKSVGILRESLFFQIIAHQIRGAALCMAHGLVFDALIGEAQLFQQLPGDGVIGIMPTP